jgi:hypothetical protein
MAEVFLIWVVTLSTSGGIIQRGFPQATWAECIEAVREAKVSIPTSGDAESTISVFCARKGEGE